jgi:hypothetical protein
VSFSCGPETFKKNTLSRWLLQMNHLHEEMGQTQVCVDSGKGKGKENRMYNWKVLKHRNLHFKQAP